MPAKYGGDKAVLMSSGTPAYGQYLVPRGLIEFRSDPVQGVPPPAGEGFGGITVGLLYG